MQLIENKIPLLVLIGPTAVGKTNLSIEIAKKINGEIISADSRSIYKGMDIATAKPKKSEQAIIKHHLIDIAYPNEIVSLSQFQKMVKESIQLIRKKNRIPILVGGTGQYIRSITQGWAPPKIAPDELLRKVLLNWCEQLGGPYELHRRLLVLDFEAGSTIDPNNLRRTIRALEVIYKTGQKFSVQKLKSQSEYNYLIIGLRMPREELYRKIDLRIESMIKEGLIDEVRRLLEEGYHPDLPSFSAIGYFEICKYLNQEIDLDEAILLMKRRTRQFVRRQANWFKMTDEEITWIDVDNNPLEYILYHIYKQRTWFV